MANMARKDQAKRTVEVDRKELLSTLLENLENHTKDYKEAMAGYKSVLLSKIDQAFADAKIKLADKHAKTKAKVSKFNDQDIAKQSDYFQLVEQIGVEMPVPTSYEKEYRAAIDIAKWDVNDTLELTNAEFTCFVRDEWDWKFDFNNVSEMYKSFA